MVQWLRLRTSTAGNTGLIPDWESSTYRAVWGEKKIQGYLDRTWPGLLFALSRLCCFSSKNCLFSREHPVGGLLSAYLLTFQAPEVKTPERQEVRASRKIWQSRPETCILDSISGSQCDSENILSSLQVFISVSVNGSGVGLRDLPTPPRGLRFAFTKVHLVLTCDPLQGRAHRVHAALTGHLHRELQLQGCRDGLIGAGETSCVTLFHYLP